MQKDIKLLIPSFIFTFITFIALFICANVLVQKGVTYSVYLLFGIYFAPMAASASFVKLSNEELEKVWGKGNDSKGLKIVIKRFIPRFIFLLYTLSLLLLDFLGFLFLKVRFIT